MQAQAAQAIIDKLVQYVVNPAILVIFSFGLLTFVFGLVQFLYNLSTGADTKEGKSHMLWGVVGMFIMVSVFGIIRLLSDTFGFGIQQGGTYNPDMSTIQGFSNAMFKND